jgi:thioredoxin-related protein
MPRHTMPRPTLSAIGACVVLLTASVVLADPPKEATKWLINYQQAMIAAKQSKKPILAYFSGSDWEPYTQKLDKDVLETDLFRHWAQQNVVLLRVDFPKVKKSTALVKVQNDKLRVRFNISTVPFFAFIDPSGLAFARGGYDDMKLHDDERSGAPRSAIKYLDATIAMRPPDEPLTEQKSLDEGMAYARKHFISLLILISQGTASGPVKNKADLLDNQQFVRFVNRSMAFVNVTWPEDSDTSPAAQELRAMLARNKVTPGPLQLLVWDMQSEKIKGRIGAIFPDNVEPLIAQIESQLPRLDYQSGWIQDLRLAQAIAAQQNRYVLVNFSSMDSSDWCQKMQKEIYDTPEFDKYARKNLVLLRIDFPTATTQPTALKTQNQTMAEMYNVRGYPTVIVLNPLGQKVSDAKYEKGGPGPLLAQLDVVLKKDTERRAMLANQDTTAQ